MGRLHLFNDNPFPSKLLTVLAVASSGLEPVPTGLFGSSGPNPALRDVGGLGSQWEQGWCPGADPTLRRTQGRHLHHASGCQVQPEQSFTRAGSAQHSS